MPTKSFPVRNALIRAYQYVIARYDVDGFRIDTLKYIERDFAQTFGNAMREFALSIGKKNFFTFGEVYDGEERIARVHRPQRAEGGDLVGVDAALDFPLFFTAPGHCERASRLRRTSSTMYRRRKEVERGRPQHPRRGRPFFVTFLDNHDQKNRF